MKESFDGLLLGSSSGGEPGGARAAKPRGVDLARKFISCAMAVVMAVSLMPLPAYAQGSSGYAAVGLEAGTLADDGDDATADEPGEAFSAAQEVDGVTVRVDAEEGAFAAGAKTLSVAKAALTEAQEEAVSAERGERNVAASYTFDIKVLDQNGNELQPAEGKKVDVSFAAPEAATSNLEGAIYHHVATDSGKADAATDAPQAAAAGEGAEGDDANGKADDDEADPAGAVEALDTSAVTVEGQAAVTAETDGFSLYTVEFTYGDLQYVMAGDTTVALADILAKVGLEGEPTAAVSSNPELVSVKAQDGAFAVSAHQAFHTPETLTVTIAGVDYAIAMTDAEKSSIPVQNTSSNSITITFMPNGGGGASMSTQEVAASTSDYLDVCPFTPPSGYYRFSGWVTDPGSYTKIIGEGSGEQVSASTDTTLYAIWDDTPTDLYDQGYRDLFLSGAYSQLVNTADDGSGGLTISAFQTRSADETTGALASPTKVYIRSSWKNKPITGIAANTFVGSGLTAVAFANDATMNANFKTIGNNAFQNLSLGALVLPKSTTTIGSNAFNGSGVTSVNFEDLAELTAIGTGAFFSCNIETVDLRNTKLTKIENTTFGLINGETQYYLPEGLISIGYRGLLGATGTLKVPSSVESVGSEALRTINNGVCYDFSDVSGSNILSWIDTTLSLDASGSRPLSINSYIKYPGDWYTNSSDFIFHNGVIYGLKDGKSGSVVVPASIDGEAVTALANGSLGRYQRYVNGSLSFAPGCAVTEIPYACFSSDYYLKSVDLSGSAVTEIGLYAFAYTTGLSSFDFGDVEIINNYAFRNTALPAADLPSSVVTIGGSVFYNSSTTTVNIGTAEGSDAASIGTNAFNCDSIVTINVLGIEKTASETGVKPWSYAPWGAVNATITWKDSKVTEPDAIEVMDTQGNYWRYVKSTKQLLDFKYKRTASGDNYADSADNAPNVKVPSVVYAASDTAFSNPLAVEKYGRLLVADQYFGTFTVSADVMSKASEDETISPLDGWSSKTSIAHLVFEEGVETIPFRFCANTNISRITFPSTLKTIGAQALRNTGPLSGAQYLSNLPDGLTEIGSYAFSATYSIQTEAGLDEIIIPASVTTLYGASSNYSFENTVLKHVQRYDPDTPSDQVPAGFTKAPAGWKAYVNIDFLQAPNATLENCGTLTNASTQSVFVYVRAKKETPATLLEDNPFSATVGEGTTVTQITSSSDWPKEDLGVDWGDDWAYAKVELPGSGSYTVRVASRSNDTSQTPHIDKIPIKAEVEYGNFLYNLNGGDGDLPDIVVDGNTFDTGHLIAGTEVTLGNPASITLVGYKTPTQWSEVTDPSASDAVYNVGDKVTVQAGKTTVLYPVWEVDEDQKVDVTYSLASNHGTIDGTSGTTLVQQVVAATAVEPTLDNVKAVPATGYHTTGWFVNGASVTEGDTLVGETAKNNLSKFGRTYQATTFLAGLESNPYTIHFDKNNALAAGTISDVTTAYDKRFTLPECTFTSDVSAFVEWNTEADGSGKSLDPGVYNATGTAAADIVNLAGKTTSDDEVTLYAIWRDSVEIALEGSQKDVVYNGEEQDNADYTLTYYVRGEKVDKLPDGFNVKMIADSGSGASSSIKVSGKNAGTYKAAVTATLEGENEDYAIKNPTKAATLVLVISPRPITVNANDAEKTYGEKDPTLSATIVGAIEADGLSVPVKRDDGEDVKASGYTIRPDVESFSNDNYTISGFTTAKLTIEKREITLKPADGSRVYGGTEPTADEWKAWTATVAKGSLATFAWTDKREADKLSDLSYQIARTRGNDVGTYDIVLTPGANKNYTIYADAGTYTITPADASGIGLEVVGDEWDYDGKAHAVKATVSVVKDTTILYSTDYKPASGDTPASGKWVEAPISMTDVLYETDGTTVIGQTVYVKATNPNYKDAEPQAVTLKANPRAVTITAKSYSKTYGEDDPELGAKVEGAVAGEELAYTVSRDEGEDVKYEYAEDGSGSVGTYAVTVKPTAGKNKNYAVTTVPGTFKIKPKPITAKAVDATKVYGTADPAFTATFTGLVYPDTKDNIEFSVVRENAKALANNQVGDYVLTVTTPAIEKVEAGKHNGNYIVQPEDGVFTITPKPVTVKAANKTQTYGGSAEPLTVKVDDGLVSGEIDGVTYADKDVTVLFPVKTDDNPSGVIELSREAGDDVGVYIITAFGPAVIGNYAVSYQGGAYQIVQITDQDAGKLGLNVGTPESNTYVYDASSHAIDAAVSVYEGTTIYYSTDYADKADDKKSEATWSTIPPSRKNVGTTKVTVKAVNPNYSDKITANTTTVDLTVNPRPATVTAESFTITYGDADPELTATEEGFLKNLDEYSASYTLSRGKGDDPADPDGKNAGTYATIATPDDGDPVDGEDGTYDQGNYRVTYVDGTLTIEKKAATVTADDKTKVYGDADPELTATVEGLVDGDPAEAIKYELSRANGDDAGEYVITVTATEDATNYEVTFVNGTFTIEKKAITVKAADADKTYGEADPAFDLVKNDDGAIVDPDTELTVLVGDDTLDYSVDRESGENAGTYAITVTLGENPNYDVTTRDGVFTINKKPITVKAEDAEKTYGEVDPAFDLVKNDDGAIVDPDTGEAVLVGDDVLDYSMARESGENAGVYAITANLGDNPNYDVTAQDGDFTINPKGVVITALDAFKVYGDADPDWADLEARTTVRGTLGDKYLSFLRDGDTTYVSVPVPGSANKYDEFTYTVSREEGEDVHDADGNIAEYAITPAGEEVQGNYKLDFVPATFTISPRDVTVTADDKSKVYGEDDPEFTAVVTGLVNDESDELITYELSRAEGENVGDYAITPAGDELQGNYRVSYADGTLTIVQKAITVMADDKTKVYGEADPAFTATVDGLVRGDGPEVLAFTLMRAAGEDVGTYAITAAGEESQGNYLVSYAPGTFTITKAAAAGLGLVGGYEGVYDAHTHTVAASVSVYDGTTIYYKDGDSNWTQNAPKIATVGSRDVLVRAENRNYETSQITMTLTVTPAPVVVTAEAKSKVYGDADPELTATVLGLIDNADIVYALTRANGENAGTYTITPAGDALQGNYKVTYLTSTLTVEQKEVGLVWADNLAYDGDEQDYEGATLTGLLSGDNVAVVYGGAMTGTDAGKYLASAQALVGTAALNYKLPANAAHTWKIAQADNSWMEKVAIAAWTAGKKPTAAQGEAEFGDVKFEFKKKGAKKSTYTTKKPTAPGTYIMRATVAGTKNYEGLVKTVKFTVKAPPMLLKSKSSKVTSSSISASWAKVPGAYRYAVYAAKCDKRAAGGVLATYKLSRLGTTAKTSYKTTKLFNGTKLQAGTYYRLQVRALNKAGKVLAKSKVVYVTTKGGTTTNAKSVKVTSPSKGKLSLSVGASKWIKAKVKGKKLRKLAQIGFASSDPTVATVNRYGSVTGKKPGTCKIYVSAQNGIYKAVKVTVK